MFTPNYCRQMPDVLTAPRTGCTILSAIWILSVTQWNPNRIGETFFQKAYQIERQANQRILLVRNALLGGARKVPFWTPAWATYCNSYIQSTWTFEIVACM